MIFRRHKQEDYLFKIKDNIETITIGNIISGKACDLITPNMFIAGCVGTGKSFYSNPKFLKYHYCNNYRKMPKLPMHRRKQLKKNKKKIYILK